MPPTPLELAVRLEAVIAADTQGHLAGPAHEEIEAVAVDLRRLGAAQAPTTTTAGQLAGYIEDKVAALRGGARLDSDKAAQWLASIARELRRMEATQAPGAQAPQPEVR